MSSPQPAIKLDDTTYYSVLGLFATSTKNELKQSYMALARQLHPDKSTSDAYAELFKVVSHAYSVLADKDQRAEYDISLKAGGLFHYLPKEGYYNFKTLQEETVNQNLPESTARPYEMQPYGFGIDPTDDSAANKNRVPIFKSFNRGKSKTGSKPVVATDFPPTNITHNTERPPKVEKPSLAKTNPPQRDEKPVDTNNTFPNKRLHRSDMPATNIAFQQQRLSKQKLQERLYRSKPITPASMSRSTSDNGSLLDKIPITIQSYQNAAPALEAEVDTVMQNLTLEDNYKIPKPKSRTISLASLLEALPLSEEGNVFDMKEMNKILNEMQIPKRRKISEDSFQTIMSHQDIPFAPVNASIPRRYISEHITLDQLNIDSSAYEWDTPKLPQLDFELMDRTNVNDYKEAIRLYNIECSNIKSELLHILLQRAKTDSSIDNKLLQVENAKSLVLAEQFDADILLKLAEIQKNQNFITRIYSSRLNDLYPA